MKRILSVLLCLTLLFSLLCAGAEELAAVELKVGAVLAKLSDERLYDFMVNRYMDFMTIEAAANEVGFSFSWGRLAVERGVAEVQAIIDGMEADGESEPEDSDLGDGSAV